MCFEFFVYLYKQDALLEDIIMVIKALKKIKMLLPHFLHDCMVIASTSI